MNGLAGIKATGVLLIVTLASSVLAQSPDENNPYGVFNTLDEVVVTDPFAEGLGATPLTPLEVLTSDPGGIDSTLPAMDDSSGAHSEAQSETDGSPVNDIPEEPIIILPDPPIPGVVDVPLDTCLEPDCINATQTSLDGVGLSVDAPLPASVLLLLSGLFGGLLVKQKKRVE